MAGREMPKDGKSFGKLRRDQEDALDKIGAEFPEIPSDEFQKWKTKFIEIDLNNSGDIDEMELKYLFEKLGQPKTHKEIIKMIAEVDTTNTGSINFRDFIVMMTGKKSSVLQKILMFEELAKKNSAPAAKGPPPKKSVTDLP